MNIKLNVWWVALEIFKKMHLLEIHAILTASACLPGELSSKFTMSEKPYIHYGAAMWCKRQN